MAPTPRMTSTVAKVLEVFLADPDAERYGLDIMSATSCPSGTIYPILMRLRRAEWLEARWEDIDPVVAGRPARRWYRLTGHGVTSARAAVAALRNQRAAAPTRSVEPRAI